MMGLKAAIRIVMRHAEADLIGVGCGLRQEQLTGKKRAEAIEALERCGLYTEGLWYTHNVTQY